MHEVFTKSISLCTPLPSGRIIESSIKFIYIWRVDLKQRYFRSTIAFKSTLKNGPMRGKIITYLINNISIVVLFNYIIIIIDALDLNSYLFERNQKKLLWFNIKCF